MIGNSQHGFIKSKSCLTNPINFYGKITLFTGKGRAEDVIYLDFSKVFSPVSHHTLLAKLVCCCLERWTNRWVWPGSEHSGQFILFYLGKVPSGVLPVSDLGSVLFNIHSSNLVEVNECTCMEFADETKLEEPGIMLKGRAVTQSNLDNP